MSKDAEEAAKGVEGFTTKMVGFAQGALSALGSLGAKHVLEDVLQKFQEAERGELRLIATLKANGREVQALTEDYKEFAAQIQEVTVLDDDAVLSLLRVAETYDLTGESAKEATKMAIAFAGATGSSAESMMRLVVALQKGDFEMARHAARMVPQLRGIKDEVEFAEKAQKLLTSGFASAAAEAESSSGRIKQLMNDYDNFKEELGAVVAEGLKPFVEMAKEAVKWLGGLSKESKMAIVAVLALVTAVLGLAAAFALAGVIFNTMFAGAGIIIGVIVMAGAALAGWAVSVGGVEKAWNKLIKAVDDAWKTFLKLADGIAAAHILLGLLTANPIFMMVGAVILLVKHWDKVTAAVKVFWEEIKPIREAVGSFLTSAFDNFAMHATNALDFVGRKFNELLGIIGAVWKMFGGNEINWRRLRDDIRDFVLFAEFSMNNFEKVFQIAMVGALQWFVLLKDNISYFFKDVIPAVFKHFVQMAKDTFAAAFVIGVNFVKSLITIIKNGVENLPDIIRDKVKLTDIIADEFRNFGKKVSDILLDIKPLKIPERMISDEEKALANLRKQMEEDLGKDFGKFRAEKQIEFVMDDLQVLFEEVFEFTEKAFGEAGGKAGEKFSFEFAGKIPKAVKIDAVLKDSAEAFSRVQAFRDLVVDQNVESKQELKVVQVAPPPPNRAEVEIVALLEAIKMAAEALAQKPPIVEAPAGLDR